MGTLSVALVVVALILALIDQVQARGRSLTCWAVICLTLALLIPSFLALR